MIEGFLRFERWLTRALHMAACAALALAACAGFFQVLSRFVLAQPSAWSEVLTRTLLIWMTYLGLAVAFRSGALASVEILSRVLQGQLRRLLQVFIAAISLVLLVTLLWQGLVIVERVSFQTLAGLDLSISWAYAAVPFGSAFAIIAVLAHVLDPRHRDFDAAL